MRYRPKQDRECMCKRKLRRVREIIAAVEKQNLLLILGVLLRRQRVCVIILSLACLALPYFSTLSHKGYDFRKNFVEHKMCVLIFSTTLSEKFLILRIIQRDIIINVRRSSCKVPLLLSDFNRT
jgi:hypothetical protein